MSSPLAPDQYGAPGHFPTFGSSTIALDHVRVQGELEALERRQAQYNSMDKRATDLSKEVKILQEALADFNTVLDKVGRGTRGRRKAAGVSAGRGTNVGCAYERLVRLTHEGRTWRPRPTVLHYLTQHSVTVSPNMLWRRRRGVC